MDFTEFDKFLVSRNEEKDGIKHNSPVSDPSFQERAESKKSKMFTKRELLKEKKKRKNRSLWSIFPEKRVANNAKCY